jgi:THO complex subunit 3
VIQTEGENIFISWSPDGKYISVGNNADVIWFIDVRNMKPERSVSSKVEVNEMSWNLTSDLFFFTTGEGTVRIMDFPGLKLDHFITAHTGNCYCLKFDPKGRYFATGGADTLVTLWDIQELVCVRTFGKLDWPVRTIGFSFDGEYIASGSEDHVIDISNIETGESVFQIQSSAATNSLAWHPSKHIIAYAGEETFKEERERDQGFLRIFGLNP